MSVKTHYSATELAAMKLPGLPSATKNVIAKAEREAWSSRKRTGRGGGFEYALTSLPAAAQEHIRTTAARELLASLPMPAPAKAKPLALREEQLPLALTTEQQTVEAARLGVLAHIENLMAGCGLSKERAMHHLLASVAAGTADPLVCAMLRKAEDKRGRKSGGDLPAVRTIKRWFAQRGDGQLAPKVKQTDFAIPWWARDFLGYWQQPQKPSVDLAYKLFCQDVESRAMDVPELSRILPSIHAVRRFLNKLGTVSRERGRLGGREIKTLLPFVRRDFDELQPNDVWSADGHCFDAEVQHPITGRPFRPEVTSIVDIATRRVVGWSIDMAESGTAVLDALRMGCEQAGMAAIFYVDNGSGYVNELMKDEGVGLMGRIGMTMLHSIAYNSQARGVIERLHQTLWVNAAKLLPSYMGADMDGEARQRQFKITRAALAKGGTTRMPMMQWDDFLRFCTERVADYNRRPHASLKGLSPDQAWQGFVAKGWQAETLPQDALALLFRPRMERTVQRGEVRLFNNQYFSRELTELHGETVHVAYDIHNPNQVWVYLPDGRFVCSAEWGANRTHYFPTSQVQHARDRRASAQLRNLNSKREAIEQERDGRPALTVIDSPMTIPGIRSSDIAGAFQRIAEPVALDGGQPLRVINAEVIEDTPSGFAVPRTAELRIQQWRELASHAERGVLLTEAETKWLASYAKSHEFKVMSQKQTASA